MINVIPFWGIFRLSNLLHTKINQFINEMRTWKRKEAKQKRRELVVVESSSE